MKVYILKMDNGMEYEDNQEWVQDVFSSYDGAVQYLLNEGYTPYTEQNMCTKEQFVQFEKNDGTSDVEKLAWILEFEVKE